MSTPKHRGTPRRTGPIDVANFPTVTPVEPGSARKARARVAGVGTGARRLRVRQRRARRLGYLRQDRRRRTRASNCEPCRHRRRLEWQARDRCLHCWSVRPQTTELHHLLVEMRRGVGDSSSTHAGAFSSARRTGPSISAASCGRSCVTHYEPCVPSCSRSRSSASGPTRAPPGQDGFSTSGAPVRCGRSWSR
jgi:hypothetical protein